MYQDYRGEIYRAFNLFPLPAGDPAYVDCVKVRGDRDVVQELAAIIDLAEPGNFTCQLYTGARGCGKSTELLRLEQRLKDSGYSVVYLEADREDIEIEDTEHTDILLACARSIINQLKDEADPKPLLTWLQKQLESLKDSQISLDFPGTVEAQMDAFLKLMGHFKAVPEVRADVRHQVELQIPSLLEILNGFMDEANRKLTPQKRGIVLIVDNLDRIVPTYDSEGHSNHEHIFHNLMRGLKCHVIYTVPISMVYSSYSPNLVENYGQTIVMPMIMVKDRNDRPYTPGINCLKEMLIKRLERVNIPHTNAPYSVDDLFADNQLLDLLCEKSGGYVRNFMQLMQSVIKHSAKLPIQETAVTRAISEMREIYRRSIYGEEWQLLADVALSKSISKDNKIGAYRELLFRRCVLEYYQTQPDGSLATWYSIHPLIEDMEQFQKAQAELASTSKKTANTQIDNTQIANIQIANIQIANTQIASQHNHTPPLSVNQETVNGEIINGDKVDIEMQSLLLSGMDEAEKEYTRFVTEKRYAEAAAIAKDIHEMCERQVESLKFNPKSDDYIAAVAWSSYWHLRYNIYNARS